MHQEHETDDWTINIDDHAKRTDSPEYVRSRKLMNRLATGGSPYGKAPFQDHHGGAWWYKVGETWEFVLAPWGIEWSAQFCADPAKVDELRCQAKTFYERFPESVEPLGIAALLTTPIRDVAGIANWVDSILNASVPMCAAAHTGRPGGVHHCPKPIADIPFFARADFVVFPLPNVAVTPLAPRGSGDGRARVAWTSGVTSVDHDDSGLSEGDVLEESHPLARAAFAKQR